MRAPVIAPPSAGPGAEPVAIADEHSVLLWQTAAYAEDLTDAARSSRRLTPAYDAMLGFLHYRLLPYLSAEEREIDPGRLRDEHLTRQLMADHERLRADVDNVESSRTRRLLMLAAEVLVDRLDHHMRREEAWVTDACADVDLPNLDIDEQWALPLLLRGDIDLDALPETVRDALVLGRLQRMRRGETLRLHASHDLHDLWRRHHRLDAASHAWVYEQSGPTEWVARVTRRADDAC
jgi:uncharacterized protein (DUF2249 family)